MPRVIAQIGPDMHFILPLVADEVGEAPLHIRYAVTGREGISQERDPPLARSPPERVEGQAVAVAHLVQFPMPLEPALVDPRAAERIGRIHRKPDRTSLV